MGWASPETLWGNSNEVPVSGAAVGLPGCGDCAILLAALASAALTSAAQLLSPFSKVQYKLICQNIQESSLH